MENGNLFQHIPAELPDELAENLLTSGKLKIERIVSQGHRSAPGCWYDQELSEWVLLLKGEAGLRFAKDEHTMHLTPGMYVHIPAHQKHRVEWTSAEEATVWLAVFY